MMKFDMTRIYRRENLTSCWCWIFSLGASLFLCVPSRAEIRRGAISYFNPGTILLGVEAQSFESRANFGTDGQIEKLPSGFRFLTYDVTLFGAYDLNDRWSLRHDLILAYGESFNGKYLRNTRRLKGLRLGVQRLFDIKVLGFIIFDGLYYQNFTVNRSHQGRVSIDDGVPWFQGGIWWDFLRQYAFLNFKAYIGLRLRPEDFSDLLVTQLHLNVLFTNHLFLGLEANKYTSINEKSFSSEIEKTLINQEYNALSQRYNILNPSLLEAYAYGGFKWSKTNQIRVGMTVALGEENTAQGFGIFLDWQTSFVATSAGFIQSEFLKGDEKRKHKKGHINLEDYGPKVKDKNKKGEDSFFFDE